MEKLYYIEIKNGIRNLGIVSCNNMLARIDNKILKIWRLTEPSEALAPTLSPREFQQTSKMPPVP